MLLELPRLDRSDAICRARTRTWTRLPSVLLCCSVAVLAAGNHGAHAERVSGGIRPNATHRRVSLGRAHNTDWNTARAVSNRCQGVCTDKIDSCCRPFGWQIKCRHSQRHWYVCSQLKPMLFFCWVKPILWRSGVTAMESLHRSGPTNVKYKIATGIEMIAAQVPQFFNYFSDIKWILEPVQLVRCINAVFHRTSTKLIRACVHQRNLHIVTWRTRCYQRQCHCAHTTAADGCQCRQHEVNFLSKPLWGNNPQHLTLTQKHNTSGSQIFYWICIVHLVLLGVCND